MLHGARPEALPTMMRCTARLAATTRSILQSGAFLMARIVESWSGCTRRAACSTCSASRGLPLWASSPISTILCRRLSATSRSPCWGKGRRWARWARRPHWWPSSGHPRQDQVPETGLRMEDGPIARSVHDQLALGLQLRDQRRDVDADRRRCPVERPPARRSGGAPPRLARSKKSRKPSARRRWGRETAAARPASSAKTSTRTSWERQGPPTGPHPPPQSGPPGSGVMNLIVCPPASWSVLGRAGSIEHPAPSPVIHLWQTSFGSPCRGAISTAAKPVVTPPWGRRIVVVLPGVSRREVGPFVPWKLVVARPVLLNLSQRPEIPRVELHVDARHRAGVLG